MLAGGWTMSASPRCGFGGGVGMSMIGMELELLVLDGHFRPVNDADSILQAGYDWLKPECSHSMVEINTVPGDIWTVGRDLLIKLDTVSSIAAEKGLYVLPIETHFGDFKPLIRQKERYIPQVKLLGEEKFDLCGEIMGQHTHFSLDADADARIRQINFLTLSDPCGIALTASSPKESFSNWRIWAYRHLVYDGFKFQGSLQPLKRTFDQYLEELDKEFEKFRSFAMESEVNIDDVMNRYNSIWGPVRINPVYGTVETRTPGSNPDIGLLLGYNMLLVGGMRRFVNGDMATEEHLFSKLADEESSAEQFKYLCHLNNEAMRYGLASPEVNQYTSTFFSFCEKGLTAEERELLPSVRQVLSSRHSVSDRIRVLLGAAMGRAPADVGPAVAKSIYEQLYLPSMDKARTSFPGLYVEAA